MKNKIVAKKIERPNIEDAIDPQIKTQRLGHKILLKFLKGKDPQAILFGEIIMGVMGESERLYKIWTERGSQFLPGDELRKACDSFFFSWGNHFKKLEGILWSITGAGTEEHLSRMSEKCGVSLNRLKLFQQGLKKFIAERRGEDEGQIVRTD